MAVTRNSERRRLKILKFAQKNLPFGISSEGGKYKYRTQTGRFEFWRQPGSGKFKLVWIRLTGQGLAVEHDCGEFRNYKETIRSLQPMQLIMQ